MEWFSQIEYWHWLIFGIVMMILEMFAPGAILLWIGASGFVVGFIQLITGGALPPEAQLALFSVFAITSIAIWKYLAQKKRWGEPLRGEPHSSKHLNQRGQSLIGRKIQLTEDIVNGVGRGKVGDSCWRVTGPDGAKKGESMKVVETDGATLIVTNFNSNQ